MKTIYRRRLKSDTWHFHPKCKHWPVAKSNKLVEQNKKPTSGELCDQCRAKAKRS